MAVYRLDVHPTDGPLLRGMSSVNDHQLLSDDAVTRVNTLRRNVERSGPPPARSQRRGRRAAP